MPMKPNDVRALVHDQLFPALIAEREKLDRIDRYWRWDHDTPHSPRQQTKEHKELAARAQAPWGGLIVTSVAQAMYVEGYRSANAPENARPWEWWQLNGMDARQVAVHRSALAYGLAYGVALPGVGDFGQRMPVMRGVSPRRMTAFYADPADDDWPMFALRADPAKVDGAMGWSLQVLDDEARYRLLANSSGDVTYVDYEVHDIGLCPVVRFAGQLDLEGRATGEIEPFIPLLARIDQTVYDRLVVQRFASWLVRYIAGMSPPERLDGETEEEWRARTKLRLQVEDLLIADDADTKFGTLAASDIRQFIDAKDADLRDLGALSQTPPNHMLGQMANLSAEALAAAESTLTRKVEERKHAFGESHEQWLRLCASIMGDDESARDISAEVRWRDMEARAFAATVDALGKMAEMLNVPVQLLWERIPGWTQQDTELAKNLVAEGDAIDRLMRELTGTDPQDDEPPVGA